jgi:hypothetical protein
LRIEEINFSFEIILPDELFEILLFCLNVTLRTLFSPLMHFFLAAQVVKLIEEFLKELILQPIFNFKKKLMNLKHIFSRTENEPVQNQISSACG